jgi:DNA polymerase epsilon subunit 1
VVKYVISKLPNKASVTERAIPIQVLLHHEEVQKRKFMKKWTGDTNPDADFSLRAVIDWDYYKERLAGTIQKIVTIPAAFQNC